MNKTIIAISNHGSFIGGGEHSFLDLLSHLPANWRILAVVPKRGELGDKLYKKKIETQVIPLPAIRLRLAMEIISCFISYFYLLKNRRPKLIYANGSRAALYGGIIGKLLNVPVIWHCRIANSDFLLDKLLTILCDRIIVNSNATARRFGPNIPPKIKVIYNGIDIEWFQEKQYQWDGFVDPDWKIILMVARVSRLKRHDLVLSAFEAVAKRDPAVHLVCIGAMDQFEADWWRHLQKRSAQSSVSERIHWIGKVDDVRPWYRTASVMVLASDNESFGRVIVEAMATGVPVIATGSGGVPEIIRNGQDGILVTPGKYKKIADAITKVQGEESLRNHLVQSALERVKLFDFGSHVQKIVEVFEET